MPLRAIIDGKQVVAPLLSEVDWDALRAEVSARSLRVVLACCDREGYLRTSATGTRHFAHKRGAPGELRCEQEGETLEHLAAKAAIVEACAAAGYGASPEVAHDDWRADVLATAAKRTQTPLSSLPAQSAPTQQTDAALLPSPAGSIAFEVQWSHLSLEDCLFRQTRYARDGVRGCWFFRNPPPALLARRDDPRDLVARRDLPLFHLRVNATRAFSVSLNRVLYPLHDFVRALLERRLRFCDEATAAGDQALQGALVPLRCIHCQRPVTFWHVQPMLTTRCGLRVPVSAPTKTPGQDESLSWLTLALTSGAVEAARHAADAAGIAAGIAMGALALPDSDAQVFRCPHCQADHDSAALDRTLYGTDALTTAYALDPFTFNLRLKTPIRIPFAHWCFPADGHFCDMA